MIQNYHQKNELIDQHYCNKKSRFLRGEIGFLAGMILTEQNKVNHCYYHFKMLVLDGLQIFKNLNSPFACHILFCNNGFKKGLPDFEHFIKIEISKYS